MNNKIILEGERFKVKLSRKIGKGGNGVVYKVKIIVIYRTLNYEYNIFLLYINININIYLSSKIMIINIINSFLIVI